MYIVMCMYMYANNHYDHYKYPTISVLDDTAISVFGDTTISTGPVLAHCDQSAKHEYIQLHSYGYRKQGEIRWFKLSQFSRF